MGESNGNIAGAGCVESAAAGRDGRRGVRMFLMSGFLIVEAMLSV